VFSQLEQGRTEFKERMGAVITERNKYREMIATRKEKDRGL
jgi:hypothetical protein